MADAVVAAALEPVAPADAADGIEVAVSMAGVAELGTFEAEGEFAAAAEMVVAPAIAPLGTLMAEVGTVGAPERLGTLI